MKPTMNVEFCGVEFKNPVLTASGTFGFGREYSSFYDLSELGGICIKGITPKKRIGNPPPRIAETPMGILNSVGLQNPGIDAFISEELPFLKQFDTRVIANISGNTVSEYCEMAEKISDSQVDLIEMNISCPNVKAGGMAFGTSSSMVFDVVSETKKYAKKPLVVKLSPNVTDITEIAVAAENAGASGLSLINTILGMRIDIKTKRPILHQNTGGLSGPAVLPIAIRMVYQVKKAVKIPLIGMGGISCGNDAVEMMLAGASLVSVGTACFSNPMAPIEVRDGIQKYLEDCKRSSVHDLCGGLIEY
ncbi:MAG: dihydroorotate dehydrogenase [Clostridiales bacterium]|nr:dihydroorotate dehydrogenase [Clostridiales bacterium]